MTCIFVCSQRGARSVPVFAPRLVSHLGGLRPTAVGSHAGRAQVVSRQPEQAVVAAVTGAALGDARAARRIVADLAAG